MKQSSKSINPNWLERNWIAQNELTKRNWSKLKNQNELVKMNESEVRTKINLDDD